MFEVVLQTRVYFYLQAYDIWDKINSAQTSKADPDFEVEGKHVDTNLIPIFVVPVTEIPLFKKYKCKTVIFAPSSFQ